MKTPIFAALALALAACASTPEPSAPSASVTLRPASGTKVSGLLKFTQADIELCMVQLQRAKALVGITYKLAKALKIHDRLT